MTETVLPQPAPTKPAPAKPARTLREWLTTNPVVLKELRGRMRGARAFVVLTVYLLVMIGFITLLYSIYLSSTSSVYSVPDRQLVGKFVFAGVVGIETLLVCFITPAFTVGAISGERERQTFDLLRTTLLPARSLVLGKLVSALSYVLLLLLAALPLQSLAFLLGGVSIEEVLIASLLLMATAVMFGTAGVFFSSLMRRTLGATVLTYAFVLVLTLGLPLVLFPLVAFAGPLFGYSNVPIEVQIGLMYILGLLISTNPVATMITTEVILVSNQTLFYFTAPIYNNFTGNSVNIPFVSPWIPFTVFAFGVAVVFLLMSIINVSRRESA